jgi:nucleotide-binding universal stress UspA family protein
MESALAKAENRLIQEGFPEGNVSTLILKGMTSRSDAIAKKASADGCGTIVVGRRGLTVVEEFIMGRVSRKVLSIADKMAVWIV